jgi:transcription antitermination factor NusG
MTIALEDLVTIDGTPGTVTYALRVPSQREFAVERILRESGFDIRIPIKHVVCRRHPHARRKDLRAVPQYRGYVFVTFGISEIPAWGEIFDLKLVRGVVGENGKPVPIPERAFRLVLLGSQRIVPYVQAFRHIRGDKRPRRARHGAEIVNGPYEGREVRMVGHDGEASAIYELFRP